MVKEKGGGVNKRYAPNSTWALEQYIKNQIQYQEATTINNAHEIRTKQEGVRSEERRVGKECRL